ncbi:hypothetical protein HAPAU_35630 [Halalkalicoccus paucihalophilus]|uniref:Uncharacterized protein n=1 Tax=Halalkalicoccus paucihalophilus TaxID=1008153 RepID=A0A151AAK3_9EURY|nr:hypothetical protein HAPAU_35630 [Halalkalicoccus paucihalophilus]
MKEPQVKHSIFIERKMVCVGLNWFTFVRVTCVNSYSYDVSVGHKSFTLNTIVCKAVKNTDLILF